MNARRSSLAQVALLLLAAASSGRAQESVVRGRAVALGSQSPIGGVEVRLRRADGAVTVLTDRDGRFHVPGVHPGDTLRLRAIGYLPTRVVWGGGARSPLVVALSPAPTTLPDLVTVTGWAPQSAAEVVMPVARVERTEIEASGATSVGDLLRELPGLQATSAPPTAAGLMIRGIGDARVLVLRDGVPVPGQQLEDRDLSRLSTAGVETIEVVKGPLSVVHGSQALGGVVNIVSQAPSGPLAIGVTAHGGSLGRRDGSLSATRGGNVAWRTMVAWRSQDRLPGQLERAGTLQRVLDAQATLRTALGGVALRVDASALRERQRWAVGGGFFGFNDNHAVTAWGEATATVGGGTWRARLTGQEYRHRFRQALGQLPFEGTGAPTQQERLTRFQLSHARAVGVRQQLDAGLEVSHRRVVAADRLIGERLGDLMIEGYVQDAARLGPFLVTAASRVTHNSRWGNAVTPSLGIAAEPTGRLRLRLGAARGFRGPTFKELGWNFLNPGAGYLVEGNASLVPESSWQLFAGATWAPTAELVVDADLYRNALRDMIDLALVGATASGLQRYAPRNLARARTQGVELAARYRSGPWLLRANYERLDADDLTNGRPLSQRAPHSAGARLSRDAGALRLDLGTRWVAAAPLYDAEGTRLADQAAFPSVDASLRLGVRAGAEVEAGVDNLLDARPAGWQVALRRTVRVGVRVGVTP